MTNLPLSEAVARFLAWATVNRAAGTVAGYRNYLNRFVRDHEGQTIADVTPATVTTWSAKWHAVQAVQRLFGWLVKVDKKLEASPLHGMEMPKTRKRKRVLSPAESARFLRRGRRHVRDLLLGMRESLARPEELRLATWASIRTADDLPWSAETLSAGHCFFWVSAGKGYDRRSESDDVRLVPITRRLGRLLLRLVRSIEEPSGNVFLNDQGKPWSKDALRNAVCRLRDRAALGRDYRGERVVAYTLRHTSATRAAAAGIGDAMLGAIMGHSTPRMTRRYVHLNRKMIREGMEKLERSKRRRK